ncbi:RCC1 domain-containing protein [Elizabethkingia anophelis]|uniref:RCC1 domain-containing protein n=1 Tax=Elizabethkingia anophelis TaxID=1117645 RepID=UPI0038914826
MKEVNFTRLIALCLILFLLFIFSCRTSENESIDGQAIIKINIEGSDFESSNFNINKLASVSSIKENNFEIPINNKYSYAAKLITENSSPKTRSSSTVTKGVKYRVVIFTESPNNTFVTQKVYTVGQSKPDDGEDLLLDGGKTYLFAIYSYNSTTAPPAVNPKDTSTLEGIPANSDLMYYSIEKTVSGNKPNYLNVAFKHKFSRLDINITAPTNRKITSITAELGPSRDNNKINLKTGFISYGNIFKSEPVIFSGLNTSIVSGYVIVANSGTETAHLDFSSVGLDGEIQNDKTIGNLKINPSTKYTLDLAIIDEGLKFETIVATRKHSYAVTTSGDVYIAGSYDAGASPFSKIQGISSIKKISTGSSHVLVLTSSGDVYVKGSNNIGQIGLGDQTYTNSFVRLTNIPKVQDIAAGDNHSLLLTTSGDVYGTGGNNYGQLGFMDLLNRTTFTQLRYSSNIKKIAAGSEHSILLMTSGEIKVAGLNNRGQLGIGNTTPASLTFQILNSINNVKDISASGESTLALTNNGEVYGAGYNENGQLGVGDETNKTSFTKASTVTNVEKISMGDFHALALTNSGEVYSCGWNAYGKLGFGDDTNRTSFTKVPGVNNIKNIAVGKDHSLLINSMGKIYGAGSNLYGQLGLDKSSIVKSFTRISIKK